MRQDMYLRGKPGIQGGHGCKQLADHPERGRHGKDRSGESRLGFISIDLNGLKTVNDTEGHEAGDRLLVQAGELLRKVFYYDDIYRTGGDEFVVIMVGVERDTFERKIGRIRRDAVKNSRVSFAIGGQWSDGSDDIGDIFREADEKMYLDKKAYYDINASSLVRRGC